MIYHSVILTSVSWGLIIYEFRWNCNKFRKLIPLLLYPPGHTGPLTLAKSPWSLQRRLQCRLPASSRASVDDQPCALAFTVPVSIDHPLRVPCHLCSLCRRMLSYPGCCLIFWMRTEKPHRPQHGAVLPSFLHSSQKSSWKQFPQPVFVLHPPVSTIGLGRGTDALTPLMSPFS